MQAEQLCPITLEHLRNREVIQYTNTGESFTYRQLEDKTLSECTDIGGTVLPAKTDSYVMFCIQSYQGLKIDRSLGY